MWEPDPSWRRLPGAGGPSSAGVWLAEEAGRTWVVKRLEAPDATSSTLRDPAHAGYWRREAEVARDARRARRAGVWCRPSSARSRRTTKASPCGARR